MLLEIVKSLTVPPRWRRSSAYLLAVAALFAPSVARAGYGVQPNGQTIEVTTDQAGYISDPQTIGILVYLDSLDSQAAVRVSTSPTWTSYGSPTGSLDGFCQSFTPWSEPNKYVCPIDTILLRPGVTYYWWLTFWRKDDNSLFGNFNVSGPFSFTVEQTSTAPPASAPSSDTPANSEPQAPTSSKTKEAAATLPSSTRWTGSRSIKDTKVTDAIYKTMKLLTRPKTLAVACWTDDDFDSVLAAAGGTGYQGDSTVTGVFFSDQPHWLHLRGSACTWLQRLIDTKAATGKGAYGLANALHEAQHAYGIRNEAQANCYAVQLVPYAAYYLGLPWSRASYLGKLALNFVRGHAPNGYWNASACRDGGGWDLVRSRTNLS